MQESLETLMSGKTEGKEEKAERRNNTIINDQQ